MNISFKKISKFNIIKVESIKVRLDINNIKNIYNTKELKVVFQKSIELPDQKKMI